MPAPLPRCRVVPLPDDQASFAVDGVERSRWHFGARHAGPFFYPLVASPGSESLTRMGHPGDPSHDHHRSIWFAHEKASGVNFWSLGAPGRVRQLRWLAYRSGDDEAVMAVRLGWFDGHDPKELLVQDLVAALRGDEAGTLLELHSTITPTSETLEFGQSNFGLIGVRVAESISVVFGGGTITGADGKTGERDLFGRANRWVDYGGPMPGDRVEGVTLFDHPANPGHPAKWHVREDGWMGPSLCRDAPVTTSRAKPLVVRYLLHAHAGPIDPEQAEGIFRDFAARPGFIIERSSRPHRAFEVPRGSVPRATTRRENSSP